MFDARSFRFPLFVHFSLLGFSGESFRSRFISTLISTKRMRCVVHHKETDLRGDGALLWYRDERAKPIPRCNRHYCPALVPLPRRPNSLIISMSASGT